MTLLEKISYIPPLLFISLLCLATIAAYWHRTQTKRKNSAPTVQEALKEKKIDLWEESLKILLLGSVIGFSSAILFFLWGITADYQKNIGFFYPDELISENKLPPAPYQNFPPFP